MDLLLEWWIKFLPDVKANNNQGERNGEVGHAIFHNIFIY